tara:strand:- start:48 stop:149 length:102 start_codon:yes stop_codon:yes gene_type:complete
MSLTSVFLITFVGWCAISWALALFVAKKFFGEK